MNQRSDAAIPVPNGTRREHPAAAAPNLQRGNPIVKVSPAGKEDWGPISRMLELYQHDLSDLWDQDLDDRGEYGYELAHYGRDQHCRAFVFRVAGRYAGFALVDDAVRLPPDEWWMAQFFVVRKYRRKGVGRLAAQAVFDSVRGRWEVGQMPLNHAAQAFWRCVIAGYTGDRWVEHRLDDTRWVGPLQCFDNSLVE